MRRSAASAARPAPATATGAVLVTALILGLVVVGLLLWRGLWLGGRLLISGSTGSAARDEVGSAGGTLDSLAEQRIGTRSWRAQLGQEVTSGIRLSR
jgi:hypothetical protein